MLDHLGKTTKGSSTRFSLHFLTREEFTLNQCIQVLEASLPEFRVLSKLFGNSAPTPPAIHEKILLRVAKHPIQKHCYLFIHILPNTLKDKNYYCSIPFSIALLHSYSWENLTKSGIRSKQKCQISLLRYLYIHVLPNTCKDKKFNCIVPVIYNGFVNEITRPGKWGGDGDAYWEQLDRRLRCMSST